MIVITVYFEVKKYGCCLQMSTADRAKAAGLLIVFKLAFKAAVFTPPDAYDMPLYTHFVYGS
jgi:hypothetical protein